MLINFVSHTSVYMFLLLQVSLYWVSRQNMKAPI